jgi:hypothetical protein
MLGCVTVIGNESDQQRSLGIAGGRKVGPLVKEATCGRKIPIEKVCIADRLIQERVRCVRYGPQFLLTIRAFFSNTIKLIYSLCLLAYKLKELFNNSLFNTDL